jgi:hypothetical protein
MGKWIRAAWLDLTGREGEQRLTEAEQTQYTLVLGIACAAGTVGWLAAGWWVVAAVLGLVAARKMQIYVRRRQRGL